jgi:phosphate transport system permease protein
MPDSLFDSGRALSVHIYDLSMNVAGGDASAHASALVLILLLLIINSIATGLANHWSHKKVLPYEPV